MKPGHKIVSILLLTMLGVCSGVLIGAFFCLTRDLPQIRALSNFKPSAATRILAGDGTLLAELYIENRDPVSIHEMPPDLLAAIIATEDRKFFDHSGIDVKGIMRAAVRDVLAGEFVEGASTITQQLAKTLFLTSQKTLFRKLQEAVLAFQIERRYTKNEILELYLNQIYLGSGAYGVSSAASIFFGKTLQDLSLAECALIAAMPRAPSRYSPLVNRDLALKRRNIVLKQMLSTGDIGGTEYQQAVNEPVHAGETRRKTAAAPYFVAYIKNALENHLGASMLYRGGLSIYTTLSRNLQATAEKAIENGLLALDNRIRAQGHTDAHPQGAVIALDIHTGEILAMVGGRNYQQSPYNRATAAKRQPGSAFKPIAYAAAIERMGFSQNMTLLDAPVIFKSAGGGKNWKPENFSRTYQGEMTLRKALARSKNIPTVRLVQMIGPATVVNFAHDLGIESNLEPYLSLALGTSEVTLLELTSAYIAFPNGGQAISPFGVLEVTDDKGHVIWRVKPRKRIVMSRQNAAIMTDMLQAVVLEGTGRRAQIIGRPVAGKTGTTDNCMDALFIGFSPDVAAGVWVGFDKPQSLGRHETGARAALPIWIEFMQKALAGSPYQYFDIPDNVVRKSMDPSTGALLPDAVPGAVQALFKVELDATAIQFQDPKWPGLRDSAP
ncbi:MAG: PBP1A family penicillin-binding protein [Deltaproteobacteria bacterium]|nr:PBP1A family penicillin-binding protein [Deltaproteobacteria bacterium]